MTGKTYKTRKSPMNKTMKMNHGQYECCDATFVGIHFWFKSMFEELGWMILAKHRGMLDKIMTYKNSVNRLRQAIEKKLKVTKDADRKDDLRIMHENVLVLLEHIEKDFA
jgi:Mg2+ and Co2+ transporter CorA